MDSICTEKAIITRQLNVEDGHVNPIDQSHKSHNALASVAELTH